MKLSNPHHLLLLLRKYTPIILVLNVLCLSLVPTARAQIIFRIDTFTTNELTITLQPSSLATGDGAELTAQLWLKSTEATTSPGWVLNNFTASSVTGAFG